MAHGVAVDDEEMRTMPPESSTYSAIEGGDSLRRTSLLRLWPYVRPDSYRIASGVLSLGLATACGMAVPLYVRTIVDAVGIGMGGGDGAASGPSVASTAGSGASSAASYPFLNVGNFHAAGEGGARVDDDDDDAFHSIAMRAVVTAAMLFAIRAVFSAYGHCALRLAASASASRLRSAILEAAHSLPLSRFHEGSSSGSGVGVGGAATAGEGKGRARGPGDAEGSVPRRRGGGGHGQILSILARDADDLFVQLIGTTLNQVSHGTVYVVGGLTLCVRVDPTLTLVVVLAGVLLGVLGKRTAQTRRHAAVQRNAASSDAVQVATDGLAQPRLVRAYGAERYEVERHRMAERHALRIVRTSVIAEQIAKNVVECLGRWTLCAVVLGGAIRIRSGKLTSGDLIGFSYYVLEVAGAIDKLVGAAGRVYESIGTAERIMELLDASEVAEKEETEGRLEEMDGGVEVNGRTSKNWGGTKGHLLCLLPWSDDSGIRDAVSFHNVFFRYPAPPSPSSPSLSTLKSRPTPSLVPPWILRDVTFAIPNGSFTALVGPSGSGKSTILDLIARFLRPDQGTVCVGGVDVRRVDPRALRQSLGWVQQESAALLRGTILDNILYGKPNATSVEVSNAANAAGAAKFIDALSDGYRHRVSREGGGLSGGQASRIAVARALVRRPRLLLLDETTSSLDAVSEAEFLSSIRSLCREVKETLTVLVVAHRLSVVRDADRIVVLEGGRVVQVGTHQSLYREEEGLYRRLCVAQGVNGG